MQNIFKKLVISNQELALLFPSSYLLVSVTGGHYAA